MSILSKLQNQPDSKKRRFALIFAGAITLCVFLAWLSYISIVGFSHAPTNTKIEPIETFKGALSEFSDSVSQAYDETKSGIASFASSTMNSTTTSPTEPSVSGAEIPTEN